MSGAIALLGFGLFFAACAAMVRFAARGQKELSGYASTGLRVARVIVPLGVAIAVFGLALGLLAVLSG
jgi:hypothetical protein